MAVLEYPELSTRFLDRVQANVSTNAPLAAADIARFLNSAYATIWELSGGRLKVVDSATAWSSAETTSGTAIGLLTDVSEVLHLWATTTAPSSISCTTNATTALTSSAAFGSVVPGMLISGSGIVAGTRVYTKADSSNLVMTIAATNSTTTTRTFSPAVGTEVQPVEKAQIEAMRTMSGLPTYSVPKIYSLTRLSTATPANVNLLQLDYWPGSTGYYFPVNYVPQFTAIDSATVTTPDVNDLESHDIFLLAAATAAPLLNRPELVPGIMADLSEKTRLALKRRGHALMDGKQNDAERNVLAG